MKGLEAAIRNALAKAGHTNAQMRARIYQSARSALESGLRKQGVSDPSVISQQRHRLEEIINAIEREERLLQVEREEQSRAAIPEPQAPEIPEPAPALQPVEPAPVSDPTPAVEVSVDDHIAPDVSHEAPTLGGVADEDRFAQGETHHVEEVPSEAEDVVAVAEERPLSRRQQKKKEKREKPRRRWRARLFSLIILIAFGFAAYWWADSSGLLLTPQQRDTSVPNPPPTAQDEDFEAPGLQSFRPERGFGEGWVPVYEPSDGGAVERGADVGTEVRRDGETRYLLVSAPAGGAGSEISVSLPQALLQQMAGRKSMIAITARGVSENAQLSVVCDLGASQGCGNHRFNLNDDRSDFIFEVETPSDAGSNGSGSISLNAAAGGADGEIELYGIHIAPDAAATGGS